MIVLLSPAKKLTMEGPLPTRAHTLPERMDRSRVIMDRLRKLSKPRIAELMHLSDNLAELNRRRYAAWNPDFTPDNARPAALAFTGDVYQGLDAASLGAADLKWAQGRVRILSGLHGLLRPLDLIQPYRLEMGTKLPVDRKKDLYAFWGSDLAEGLRADLAAQKPAERFVLNLASAEYAKAARLGELDAPVISADFREFKNGAYKPIQLYLKQARGLMTRWVIRQRVTRAEDLPGFDLGGYRYDAASSTDGKLVFLRG